MVEAIRKYLEEVAAEYRRGNATEHSYRPALKRLVESNGKTIHAVNEPRRVECGAPDFEVSRAALKVGYLEAKDIGKPLDDAERSEQLKRYFRSLENLILTDYLEFRWYVNGEIRSTVKLGQAAGGRILHEAEQTQKLAEMLKAFIQHKPQTIRRPKALALRMASLTHMVRDMIVVAFEKGAESETLRNWRSAFAQTLLQDLEKDERLGDFADMFAQTIAYGLFFARVMDDTPEDFSMEEAQRLIPKSNPFLRNFFYQITGPDLRDEPYAGFVNDLVGTLAATDMPRVLEDFGVQKKTRDPAFHFYETFLAEYDPKLREARGVYYTPDPVVSYIVRSVDLLLKSKFGCANGLADDTKVQIDNRNANVTTKQGKMKRKEECHKVLVLDPACGTGTFLYDVVKLIRERFIESNDAGTWPLYVKKSLLPRLFGFELMMAPYAVAHFKLGMQLAGRDLLELQEGHWKYELGDEDRLQIYLTNTLEDMHDIQGLPLFARWIANETEAANRVKRDLPIMVICGNPPYSGHSENNGEWIRDLIDDYKMVAGQPLGERNSKWLQDDYVKFIRFSQWRLDQSGGGILAFISNNGYLDNPTFRGMRWSLMQSFNDIYILNLHGSLKKRETTPDGSKDENVFDIQQGVCIGIFVKQPGSKRKCQVHYADLWGERQSKYNMLEERDISKTKWKKIDASEPNYLFLPFDGDIGAEYTSGFALNDIFPKNSMGVTTARDALVVGFSADEVLDRMRHFVSLSPEGARTEFSLGKDAKDWLVSEAQKDVLNSGCSESNLIAYSYRIFDNRHAYYTGESCGLMCRPRTDVMRHLAQPRNKALCFIRRSREDVASNFFVTDHITDKTVLSSADNANVAPLYFYLTGEELFDTDDVRKPNLSAKFIAELTGKLGMIFVSDGVGDLVKMFGPEDVFHYIYAVLNSPTYRERYADFLKIDFPRVPTTSDKKLFANLANLGRELCALHLMEFEVVRTGGASASMPADAEACVPPTYPTNTSFPVAGSNEVAKGYPRFIVDAASCRVVHEQSTRSDATRMEAASTLGRVHINKTQYFEGVPEFIWNFTIGGYQVCEKWLKDRRGRTLSLDDVRHYQKIIVALQRTVELMKEIDGTIPQWPIQ